MENYYLRINDKLEELQNWIEEFEDISSKDFENNVILAACERYCERIIETMIKISQIILKSKGIQDREKSFQKLYELKIVSKELALNLEEIKGMRNLMIHQYEEFDQNIFQESLNELITDAKKFILEIKK